MRHGIEDYEIYVTKAPMDACAVIRERAATGEEIRVYACGGDGTLNECVNGAAERPNVALTHCPAGTGNDFIRVFGDKMEQFRDLDVLLADSEERVIDLIRCNDRYSINICSVGVDARIGTDVHKYSGLPMLSGHSAYMFSDMVNMVKGINRRFTVRIDGEKTEGEFALICACNGQYYGGGFNPVPEAKVDDGFLDFLIINKVSRLKFARFIGAFKDGRYKELPPGYVRYRRGRSLSVSSDELIRVNVDGELLESKEVEFAICPGKLRFFGPRGLAW